MGMGTVQAKNGKRTAKICHFLTNLEKGPAADRSKFAKMPLHAGRHLVAFCRKSVKTAEIPRPGLTSRRWILKIKRDDAERGVVHLKILTQIGIIFGICWVSVWIEQVLPFTLPASIIGMLLLLLLLMAGLVKPAHIQEKSDFLLANLPFFFIPAAVSILNYMDVLKSNLLALAVICVVPTFIVFAVTVWAVRITCRLLERRDGK